MSDMQDTNQPQQEATDTPQGGRRPWERPALTEYGHLAKLTRGASGGFPDGSLNRRSMCL